MFMALAAEVELEHQASIPRSLDCRCEREVDILISTGRIENRTGFYTGLNTGLNKFRIR